MFQLCDLLFQFDCIDTMTLKTVLVIEDDRFFRQMLREGLEEHNFLVLEAACGERSVEVIEQQQNIDIILLDLYLPDGNGVKFIPLIRQFTDAPLIIVSGEERSCEKIKGFAQGADDYVEKPLDFDVLLARIQAHLRRYQDTYSNQNSPQQNSSDVVRMGEWVLDFNRYQIYDCNDQPGELTFKEFQLLALLISNPGRAISRDELCEAIREDNYVPNGRAIDVKITRIRRKIGDDAHEPRIIQTVRSVGYMFCS